MAVVSDFERELRDCLEEVLLDTRPPEPEYEAPAAPPAISSTTSSKRISTSPLISRMTAPDSGRTAVTRGGAVSGGPPGGGSILAQPSRSAAHAQAVRLSNPAP